MKKIKITALLIIFGISFCQAQNLQDAAKQKQQQEILEKQQKEAQLQEQARLLKAQLNLTDLLDLLKSKDLDYVDKFLTSRGWTFEETNIDEDGNMPDEYEMVTWSLDKNESTKLSKGWFHFYRYTKYDNAILYRMANEDHLQRLENDIETKGYLKTQYTDAITRGLESTYRNEPYEIIFRKTKKRQDEQGSEMQYEFFIYNYKDIEQQLAEIARLEQEAIMLELLYQSTIESANTNFEQNQYEQAKQDYNYALKLKPENADFINSKIKEIDKVLQFLNERNAKTYNYAEYFASEYEQMNERIISSIKNILFNEKSLNFATLTITTTIDTAGITSTTFTSTVSDAKLKEKLEQISNNVKLRQPSLNGYTVSAKAVFDYTISTDDAIIKVEKNAEGIKLAHVKDNAYRSTIGTTLSSAPMGKFTFQFNKTTINGKEYVEDNLLKYKGTGGPENAWLSLLVPGLGDHRVTYGQKSGLATALSTYGLIGVGIGFKLYAENEYKNAIEQSQTDTHYSNATTADLFFYGCVGAGAIIWIYDIIWVWNKGAQNKKTQKAWKQSNVSFYYEPNINATGLTYTLKF